MISRSMIGILVGTTGTVGIVGGGSYLVYSKYTKLTPKQNNTTSPKMVDVTKTVVNPSTPQKHTSVTTIEESDSTIAKHKTVNRTYVFFPDMQGKFTPTSTSCVDKDYCKTTMTESLYDNALDVGVNSNNEIAFYSAKNSKIEIKIPEKFQKIQAQNNALIQKIDQFLDTQNH